MKKKSNSFQQNQNSKD